MGHGLEAHHPPSTLKRTALGFARASFAVLALGACTGVDATEADEPVATTTHALLRVERSALVGAEHDATAMAFAGVVRVPEAADADPLLRLAGKSLVLPAVGQCLPSSRERDGALVSGAEFLEAGEVRLAASGAETLLAPRLFEALKTELSGVVYTSRDRASEPLPGGASYVLRTTGSDQLPALELRVDAPALLSDVVVGGAALEGVSQVSTASELPLGWRAGEAGDVVYVEVTSADAGTLGVCAFRDADGRGVLPPGLFGASGGGVLSFHRLREVAAEVGAVDAAEVRFDFELSAEVSFQ